MGGQERYMGFSDFGLYALVHSSDESEPSWLEPELELKDFQLGSARPKMSRNFDFDFSLHLLNLSFQLLKKPFVLYKFIKSIMQLISIGYNHDTGRK